MFADQKIIYFLSLVYQFFIIMAMIKNKKPLLQIESMIYPLNLCFYSRVKQKMNQRSSNKISQSEISSGVNKSKKYIKIKRRLKDYVKCQKELNNRSN